MAQKKTDSTTKTLKTTTRRAPRKSKTTEPITVPISDSQTTYSPEQVAELAYSLWENRGRPLGSPDEDWYCAEKQLNG